MDVDSVHCIRWMVSQFRAQGQFHVVQVLWLPIWLYGFCGFNLFDMYLTTDDEWLFAIVIISIAVVFVIFAFMVAVIMTYNRRSKQKKDFVKIISDMIKPSS